MVQNVAHSDVMLQKGNFFEDKIRKHLVVQKHNSSYIRIELRKFLYSIKKYRSISEILIDPY